MNEFFAGVCVWGWGGGGVGEGGVGEGGVDPETIST